jgi:hypothetical protein
MDRAISEDLDGQIAMTHEQLVRAVAARLPTMPLETKERYFVILSTLVTKLANPEKPLRDILGEMMSEAASFIFREPDR